MFMLCGDQIAAGPLRTAEEVKAVYAEIMRQDARRVRDRPADPPALAVRLLRTAPASTTAAATTFATSEKRVPCDRLH
jgi:hypothetical protein